MEHLLRRFRCRDTKADFFFLIAVLAIHIFFVLIQGLHKLPLETMCHSFPATVGSDFADSPITVVCSWGNLRWACDLGLYTANEPWHKVNVSGWAPKISQQIKRLLQANTWHDKNMQRGRVRGKKSQEEKVADAWWWRSSHDKCDAWGYSAESIHLLLLHHIPHWLI